MPAAKTTVNLRSKTVQGNYYTSLVLANELSLALLPPVPLRRWLAWSSEFLHSIELTSAPTAAHRTRFVIGKPAHHVMGVSTMFAPHAPCKPLSKWQIGTG